MESIFEVLNCSKTQSLFHVSAISIKQPRHKDETAQNTSTIRNARLACSVVRRNTRLLMLGRDTPHELQDESKSIARYVGRDDVLSNPGLLYEIDGLKLSLQAFDELWTERTTPSIGAS